MNPNRQKNRCGTPIITPFGNRPMGRPVGRPGGAGVCGPTPMPCPEVCAPCPDNTTICQEGCNTCAEDCDTCSSVCNSCSDNSSSGVIISGCGNACDKESSLQGMALAMAYVPWQPYTNLYSLSQALRQGTIFRDLDFEFLGRRCN